MSRIAAILTNSEHFSWFVGIFLLHMHRKANSIISSYNSDISVRSSDSNYLWAWDILPIWKRFQYFFGTIPTEIRYLLLLYLTYHKFAACAQIREYSSCQLLELTPTSVLGELWFLLATLEEMFVTKFWSWFDHSLPSYDAQILRYIDLEQS